MSDLFTSELQTRILALLVKDKDFLAKMQNFVKPYYFESDAHMNMCRIILDYYHKYKLPISINNMLLEVKDYSEDYTGLIEKVYTYKLADRNYLRDKVTEFVKFQEYKSAIEKSIDFLKAGSFDEVKREWSRAFSLSTSQQHGMFYFDPNEIDERFKLDTSIHVPIGLPEFDEILDGGLSHGELGILMAPPNVGKTKTLCAFGAGALRLGKKVAHFSLEMSARKIGLRYDRNILGKNTLALRETPDDSKKFLVQFHKNLKNNLYIKQWPTRTARADDVRAEIEWLLSEDFKIDMLIVDYAAIMKPMKSRDGRHQEIEENCEELRAIAGEYDLACWSAAQTTKDATSKATLSIEDLGESFAQSKVADVIPAYCQTKKEYENNEMRIVIAKNRDNRKFQVLRYAVNDDIMRITYIGEE
jgi:replicative DNA helicase